MFGGKIELTADMKKTKILAAKKAVSFDFSDFCSFLDWNPYDLIFNNRDFLSKIAYLDSCL